MNTQIRFNLVLFFLAYHIYVQNEVSYVLMINLFSGLYMTLIIVEDRKITTKPLELYDILWLQQNKKS